MKSGEAQVESRDPTGVQVEPGGETSVERDGSTAHEDVDVTANSMGEEEHGVQDEAGRSATCRNASIERERGSALALGRSTTTDEEIDQRNEAIVDDVPEDPPVPPPPLERPLNAENEPPSVELEGKRISHASCDDELTSGDADALGPSIGDEGPRNRPKVAQDVLERVGECSEHGKEENSPSRARVGLDDPGTTADASGASGSVEDPGNMPKKLRKVSEPVRKRSKLMEEENSPGRPQEEPYDPGGEMAVPGGAHNVQERSRKVSNERVDETDTPHRVREPGGHRDLQEAPRVVEGAPDCAKVVDSAGHDGTSPRSSENAHGDGTNTPCRNTGPGGHLGERGGSRDVECNRECQSNGDRVERDGRRCRMDGAPSGPHRDSTRVETEPLAADETGQRRWYKRDKTDVPRPSTAPTIDHRPPADHPDPPRH